MRESRSSRTLRPPGCAALASDTIAEPPRFHLGYPARSFTSVTRCESKETSRNRGFAVAGTTTPVITSLPGRKSAPRNPADGVDPGPGVRSPPEGKDHTILRVNDGLSVGSGRAADPETHDRDGQGW